MDFHYLEDGLFFTLIPNSTEAIKAWNEVIAPVAETGKFFKIHFDTVKQQIEDAGYTIGKSPAITESDDELLAGLQ